MLSSSIFIDQDLKQIFKQNYNFGAQGTRHKKLYVSFLFFKETKGN